MLFSPDSWDHQDLPILLDRRPTFPVRTPYRPIIIHKNIDEAARRKRLSILLGSVIGGTMLLTIIFVTLHCTTFKHNNAQQPANPLDSASTNNDPTTNSDSSGTMVTTSPQVPKHIELEAREIVEVPNNVYVPPHRSPTMNGDFKGSGRNSGNSNDGSPTRDYYTYRSDEQQMPPQSYHQEEGDYAYYEQLQRVSSLRQEPQHHCRNCGSPVEVLGTRTSF